MNNNDVKKILELVQNGEMPVEQASDELASFMDFGHVKADTSRMERLGFDEVIYGKAKTVEQISQIAEKYIEKKLNFACTGLDAEKLAELEKKFPMFIFNKEAGIMKMINSPAPRKEGLVAIITAGTSDMKVAAEASEMLDICGVDSRIYADIGVAGIHRFFSVKEEISRADVIIVIAGMEGALPSIAGGAFPQPVIAVPTSTGYGTALSGFTALFAMLSSCANGITVVNIDNGFGAAMAALRIINLKTGAKMELKQAIEQRRSINFFDPYRKIDSETIEKILELAALAPSSMNLQPWKVLTVVSEDKKTLLRKVAKDQPKVTEASAVFVLLGDLDYIENNLEMTVDSQIELGYMDADQRDARIKMATNVHQDEDKRYKTATLNASLFGMNLMYACAAYGVETHPMGGFDPGMLITEFGLSDRLIPVMLVAAGYLKPDIILKPRAKRLSPSDFNHIL